MDRDRAASCQCLYTFQGLRRWRSKYEKTRKFAVCSHLPQEELKVSQYADGLLLTDGETITEVSATRSEGAVRANINREKCKGLGVGRSQNEQTSLMSRVTYDLIPDKILGVQFGNVGLSSPQLGSKD